MPETLSLTAPRSQTYAPGVESTTAALEIMSFNLHREPVFDAETGALAGWQGPGSYAEVILTGAHGRVETVRLYEGTDALTAINQLNTVNLATKSLRQRLMELVQAHVVDGETPYAGTLT